MLDNVHAAIETVRRSVSTVWRFLRDLVLSVTPSWVPLSTVGMFFVAMPPILFDLWFTGLQLGPAFVMRCCIASTKVALAFPFYRVRCLVMSLRTNRAPTRIDRFIVDGPLYSTFHVSLFMFYASLVHNFWSPLDVAGTQQEMVVLTIGGFITGPFWMKHIFDYLHEADHNG